MPWLLRDRALGPDDQGIPADLIQETIVKRLTFLTALLLTFICHPALRAQTQDPSLLTIDRIFNSSEFRSDGFGPARWLRDGSGYTTLERSADTGGGVDIVRYDPETGDREILVPASLLVPPGGSRPLGISDYSWSWDGRLLLIFTNTRRVWRQNTRGDYWVLDLESRDLRQLGSDSPPSTLMFAKLSPDGSRAAYVSRNNIYMEHLRDGRITQLTKDGSGTVVNGTSDWVYEEEFSLRDGFRWSPDGGRIAYWQFDTEGVGTFFMINNTDSIYSRIVPVQYPKVGTTNSACRVGVVSADGGPTTWFALTGDPRDNYVPKMEWAANSDEVVIQYLNRLQNTNRVILGNARTGEVRAILIERDEAWLDPVDDLKWLDGGSLFMWVSERDGWRHVYLVSRSGKEITTVTLGEFDVISVTKIDEEGGWLYYIAAPDNPGQRYLYRTRLYGPGEPQRISPAGQPGTHGYQISHDSKWAFHTRSSFQVPPVIELVRLPSHEVVRTITDNARLREKVEALKKTSVEFFRADIGDGILLDGWQMKPYDFDPAKKYPVLFYVYGEPWGQTVQDSWGGNRYLWHLMLTQQGYLVMSVDNRGTPAPRGREWRKIIYRQIGILASADQAAAVREIGEWPYVDSSRVGIWGWSGGGSMSLNAIFRYPDLYHTAISVAPVPDQRLYDTIYQERYMGLPDDNEEGYRLGSPITFAHQLKGNLLLVHGTGDDNVHFQGSEALVNALIAANRQFTFMAYPNRSHGIYEGRNTTRHLYTLLTRYLLEKLPAGPSTR
ncbi:MAG: S9 family peptidase [Candidatus Latescibacteria bacterium]|nr:S9 family peptidase [Candidatus Latescibacterota bacterium]